VPWLWEVAERDHDIQNPCSPEKIRLLGERLRLGPESRVLDIACGRGGPALLLADTFGAHVTGVERSAAFAQAARERAAERGLTDRIELVDGDAAAFPLEPGAWDAALCLGASFVFGGLDATLAALTPSVRPGGHVAVGEPYLRRPLPDDIEDEGFLSLEETAARLEPAGLHLVGLVAASEDDWDRYESLHWQALEEWLAAHPDDPDAEALLQQHERSRREYLRVGRDLFGWAILVGLKPQH
jgi:SAM-dependent methyltransferase